MQKLSDSVVCFDSVNGHGQHKSELSVNTHLDTKRIVVEIRSHSQTPVSTGRRVQLLLQSLPVEDFDQALRVGPVVLKPLLHVTECLRVQCLDAQTLTVRMEEVHHQLEGGVEAVVEHRGYLLVAGAAVHLVVELGEGVFPHLGNVKVLENCVYGFNCLTVEG